jgi:hypothetical protein
MTAAKTPITGPPAAGPAGGNGVADPADVAGRLLGRLTVLPALLATAWLLAGLPLLLLGEFTPVAMLVTSVPIAVVLVVLGVRWIPGRWEGPLPLRKPEHGRTPWWTVVSVIAVAVAFGVDQLVYHSEFLIVMRDPASYMQFANWIAHHGSLPIPQDRAAFGGSHPGLSFDSFAFYQVGSTVVPQFMAGLPMVLAGGYWAGGVSAALVMAPVLGALAVLTFGGLAARLVGPRWAPLAALILAISLPEMFTSRSTYSEPLVQILFLGGFCLVIDSFGTEGTGRRVIAGLGGLALGLTLLVRVDGASDMLPVIPYCGLLLLGRRRQQAIPLLGGLVVGAVYGGVDGIVLSRPYLASIKSSLYPLALVGGLVVLVVAAAVVMLWHRGLPTITGTWLPNAAAAAAFVVIAGFAIRPYFQTVRVNSTAATENYVASMQRADHLPVDPSRLYYELSLHWVFWYVGLPAVLLGTLGAALLARRCLWGRAPVWTLPLMTFAWTIVVTLYRPAITPDQPWASRRLVPAVLPGFVLLAVWGMSWLIGRARRSGYDRVTIGAVTVICGAALVLPAAMTSFGLGVKDGGPLGLKPTADGLAVQTTYAGEVAAMHGMCAAIPANASVVFLVYGLDGEWLTEDVRGTCNVPVARLHTASSSTVEQVVRGIERARRRPVLLTDDRADLTPYGGPVRQIMTLKSTQDGHSLTTPPTHTWSLTMNVWMSEPSR